MKIEIHYLHPVIQSKYQTGQYGDRPDVEIICQVDDYFVRDGVLYIKTKEDMFDGLEDAQVTLCLPIVNIKKWVPQHD